MIAIRSNAAKPRHSSTTVIDLTIDTIDHIDLTLDDSPPTSPRGGNGPGEPPRKRRKHDGGFRTRGACLKAQVKPYIEACLAELPSGLVDTSKIKPEVMRKIGSFRDIEDEITSNKGFLSKGLEERVAQAVRELIEHYASLPDYQLDPTPKISPAPATLLAAPLTPTPAPATWGPSPVSTFATAPARLSLTPAETPTHSVTARRQTREVSALSGSPTKNRTKAIARTWKPWKVHATPAAPATARQKARCAWLRMVKWPYITTDERETILRGASKMIQTSASAARDPVPFHVDFTPNEIEAVRRKVREMYGKKPKGKRNMDKSNELGALLRKQPGLLTRVPKELELKGDLARRDEVAIRNLLDELVDKRKRPARQPKVYTLEVDESNKPRDARPSNQIPSLLFAREIDGNRGFGSMRRLVNFTNAFRKAREDDMEVRAEWVNCAGDIMTITWTSNKNFICGTTTHSDSHNQQYNRDGNLLLYSSESKELKAFPDHRIPRPVVEKGDNSTEAMRESQSPWLYSSVVSSDYDKENDRAYTSSFDKTVKVWKVDKTGKDMTVLGAWEHTGNVNFVVASKHESGMVATAADVPNQAIRVYQVLDDNVFGSPYRAYSGSRAWNEDDEHTTAVQKWAYFPATMQWGLAKDVQHLLLVGYSPRSFTGDDNDIPLLKRNTGEICLWNCLTGERIRVLTATTQNVFEVAWHPTQPAFVVATSPAGLMVDPKTYTQIRVFRPVKGPDGEDAFNEIQCLDCPAKDINELTIKPNSVIYSYVTAACTDGKVYVWDTSRGDKPIHALAHKDPIDPFEDGGDREDLDVGVKFMAWGTTPDRFYTGGSDGVVKVWNVRNLRQPLVRKLLESPGCISCGAFSPDFSKLAVGDASGRVMLLSLDQEDEPPLKPFYPPLPPGFKLRRRPQQFKGHGEPPPPANSEASLQTGVGRARHFLASQQLTRHRNPTVGVVQGPEYSNLGLYRHDYHFNGEPSEPLLAQHEEKQQENQKMFRSSLRVSRIRPPAGLGSAILEVRHIRNRERDLYSDSLDEMTKMKLRMENIHIDDPIHDQGFNFEYEEEPIDYEEE